MLLRSMRLRMTVSFAVLLVVFGWLLSLAISHSSLMLMRSGQLSQQHHIVLVLTTFMGVLFPAAAVGTWVLVGRTLRPLRSLSRQADESTAARLVSPSSDLEMTELVSTINRLLDRIEMAADAKARFYAAASHELRTPLQALNGHIETALSKERPEGEYRAALVEAQRQTQRLTTLTRDILTLHQLQAQHLGHDERADLAESIRIALAEVAALVEARGLEVKHDIPLSLVLPGRQSFADICVRNLIENAVRYASGGSEISISLEPKVLTITNRCDLPESADLEGFFEPFAASKGVGAQSRGNGLGLAICRAAANANGWSTRLRVRAGVVVAKVSFLNT